MENNLQWLSVCVTVTTTRQLTNIISELSWSKVVAIFGCVSHGRNLRYDPKKVIA
jgi:hypothetical protein